MNLNLKEKKLFILFIQKGDTILITAVKGGHKEIMDALMSRHVEIDAVGNVNKHYDYKNYLLKNNY